MAGRGSRLRPHTHTVPKPLIPIAGKPIVQRLVEDIAKVVNQKIEEIAFVTDKSFKVEKQLEEIANSLDAKASIYYQGEPLGTGHAIMCAKESLYGPCIVAYADTLFKAEFDLDPKADAVVWVKQVEKPEAYGVVKLNDSNEVVELVEKPKEKVSDLAVIGIYYFKEGEVLKNALQKVLDAKLTHSGEYQINDGIKGMMDQSKIFKTGKVNEWLDCGNKKVTVETNARYLEFLKNENLVATSATLENSVVIPPVYIGENAIIKNSVIGPNVSIGENCIIENSIIAKSLIQTKSKLSNANLSNSMIGNKVVLEASLKDVSLGDDSVIKY